MELTEVSILGLGAEGSIAFRALMGKALPGADSGKRAAGAAAESGGHLDQRRPL